MSTQYSEITRLFPSELIRGEFSFDGNQLSSQAASAIDQNILRVENPNNCTDLAPALPLEQYKLNVDNNPHVIRRKAQDRVQYAQEIAVKYLKPPAAPRGGDIIIQQQASRQVAPAPPLIVRQAPPKPPTPPPLVIREAPPQPPQPLPGKTITIPGKTIPPPARKVIVERLAPEPAKPQQVFIERWLQYGPQSQKVIYQPARPACVIPDPKNVVIQWEAPEVDIRQDFKNLGVSEANPQEYLSRYGSQLVRSDALPEIAVKFSQREGVRLAATSRQEGLILEGDVQALRLIDLDKYGLGYLRASIGAAGASGASASYSAESSYSAGGAAGGFGASAGGFGGAAALAGALGGAGGASASYSSYSESASFASQPAAQYEETFSEQINY